MYLIEGNNLRQNILMAQLAGCLHSFLVSLWVFKGKFVYIDNCHFYSVIKLPYIWKSLTFSTSFVNDAKASICYVPLQQHAKHY